MYFKWVSFKAWKYFFVQKSTNWKFGPSRRFYHATAHIVHTHNSLYAVFINIFFYIACMFSFVGMTKRCAIKTRTGKCMYWIIKCYILQFLCYIITIIVQNSIQKVRNKNTQYKQRYIDENYNVMPTLRHTQQFPSSFIRRLQVIMMSWGATCSYDDGCYKQCE